MVRILAPRLLGGQPMHFLREGDTCQLVHIDGLYATIRGKHKDTGRTVKQLLDHSEYEVLP